jgi:hypothetical protein
MPLRNLAHRTFAPLALAATLPSATGALAQDGAVPAASPVKGEAAAAKPEKK